jgi:hypothetical protein
MQESPPSTCSTPAAPPLQHPHNSPKAQGAKTLCIYMPWLGDAVSGGLEPQPQPYNITPTWPCPNFPKIHPHPYGRNWVRVHPYAHPQHLKVLKHVVYIQYGCGKQSMGVCSLNHDTATSYRLGHTPFPLKFTPTCTCNASLVCTHMPIHSISRCSNTLYIQYGCGMQSLGVCSLNHDLTTSYRLSAQPYPIFPKIHPTCTCNTA